MTRKDLPLVLAFILILLLFVLCGCQTIPHAPKRDQELLRQCVKLNDSMAQKLFMDLKRDNAPIGYQNDAEAIYLTSEAIVEWVGYPEKRWTGSAKKIAEKMKEEDRKYDRDLSEWKGQMSRFEGESIRGNIFSEISGIFKWAVALTAFVGGVLIAFKFF